MSTHISMYSFNEPFKIECDHFEETREHEAFVSVQFISSDGTRLSIHLNPDHKLSKIAKQIKGTYGHDN